MKTQYQSNMNPNTKLEEQAEQFRRDTGMTAPFKDTRDGSGWEDRHHAWNDWKLRNEIAELKAAKAQSDFAATCIIDSLKEQLTKANSNLLLVRTELECMVRAASKQDWEESHPNHMQDANRAIFVTGGTPVA